MTRKQFVVIIFLLLAIYLVFLPDFFALFDLPFWQQWIAWIQEDGIENIYTHDVNYHPIVLYWFAFYEWVCGSTDTILAKIKYIKVLPLMFDFLGALSILLLFKNNANKYFYCLLLLLNGVYFYNTLIWGQFDSIPIALIVFSITALLYQNLLLGAIFAVIAFNVKLQVIIFFPLIFLLAMPLLKSIKSIVQTTIFVISTQALIIVPFILNNTAYLYWGVITGAVGHHPMVSLNAYNWWYWVIEKNPKDIIDTSSFFYLNYHKWGFILFGISFITAITPLLYATYLCFKKSTSFNLEKTEIIFLTATLVSLCFFFFPTQMHERYSHPAILLSFIYGCSSGNFLIHILICIAYFLNLERILQYFEFNNYGTVIYMGEFVAGIYAVAIIIAYIRLYRYAARIFRK